MITFLIDSSDVVHANDRMRRRARTCQSSSEINWILLTSVGRESVNVHVLVLFQVISSCYGEELVTEETTLMVQGVVLVVLIHLTRQSSGN